MSDFYCYLCNCYHDISMLKKGTYYETNKGKCKAGHSLYTSQHLMRKRVEKNPENFFECEDCDRYMSKFMSGGNGKFNRRKEIDKCKFCDSGKIIEVLEA